MSEKQKRRYEISGDWPFLVAFSLFALNTDFVVNHILKWLGLTGGPFLFWLSVIATAELFGWFWFFSWLLKKRVRRTDTVQGAVALGKRAGTELKDAGFFGVAEDFFKEKITKASNSLGMRALKYGGYALFYVFLFGVAAEPLPFGRMFTVILCSLTRSRVGLILVVVGNLIHIYAWNNFILENTLWKIF